MSFNKFLFWGSGVYAGYFIVLTIELLKNPTKYFKDIPGAILLDLSCLMASIICIFIYFISQLNNTGGKK